MATTSPGYSIIIRANVAPELHARGAVVAAVSKAGAVVTALDMVDPTSSLVVLDISCDARDSEHVASIRAALDALEGCHVEKVSDRTFLTHIGGKIEINVKVPMRNRDDLARAYTPGVARVCMAIANNPEVVRNLTIKRNTVAVVTDGTAVLGLGDIGPAAAMPVMEGKAALFKKFADVDAWPICLDTTDVEEIIRTVEVIAPGFGGINLEDISAPRCFEIEARLRERLNIPVFHDDQHGRRGCRGPCSCRSPAPGRSHRHHPVRQPRSDPRRAYGSRRAQAGAGRVDEHARAHGFVARGARRRRRVHRAQCTESAHR